MSGQTAPSPTIRLTVSTDTSCRRICAPARANAVSKSSMSSMFAPIAVARDASAMFDCVALGEPPVWPMFASWMPETRIMSVKVCSTS